VSEWQTRRASHTTEYELARSGAVAHAETLSQVQALEERLAELNESADIQEEQLVRLGDPEVEFTSLRSNWVEAHAMRAEILARQCDLLSTIPSSRLRATLKRAADIGPLEEKLRQVFRGSKARGDRIERLVQQVSSAADPLGAWQEILDELQALAWIKVDDEAITLMPSTPRLESAGLTSKEKLALTRQLTPATWLDLFLFDLNDLPVFEYQIREDDYLPFERASPGQQATALLSILLLQDGPPLLIDQPEDDLNMKIINDVVATLWNAKVHRQVIFASHNANLVVNGDAELVICSDYRTHATESGGQLKLAGAIDMPAINREITDVMEGGVAAFKLRHQKYGF
jgi:type III restriction enzyme